MKRAEHALFLAAAGLDAGSDTAMLNALLVAGAIFAVVVLGVVAAIVIHKQRKLLLGPQREEALLSLPPSLAVPALPAAPVNSTERHRQEVAIENMARDLACRLAKERDAGARSGAVWILAGSGPLGAVAMALARHLEALNIEATVQQMQYTDRLGEEACAQRKILIASKLRLLESPAPRPLHGVARLIVGAPLDLLSEARQGDLERIWAAAQAEGIPVEALDDFSPFYASPPPEPDDPLIPVPGVALTREETRMLDASAQQAYGLSGAALMENAGYWAAREAYLMALSIAAEQGQPPALTVVCGRGNNGGDGFVAARHLLHWGCTPAVFLLGMKDKVSDDAGRNLGLLEEEGVKVTPLFDETQWPLLAEALRGTHLIVDALLGTGMTGPVRGPALEAIRLMNAARGQGAKIVALDGPSGIDCNTGEPLGACVHADVTVTFAANKLGFTQGQGSELCGHVVLADIGLPREIYRRREALAK